MWISVVASIICIVVIVALFVRWRVICTWHGGLIEVRLRFLGVSRTVWRIDMFERDSAGNHPGPQGRDFERIATILGEIVDRIQALLDHQDVLISAGRAGLQLARRFRHWWRLDRGTVELTIGLRNPAHTGMAHGALSAVSGMIGARWPQIRIVSLANFDGTVFNCRGEVVFSIRAWDPCRDLLRFGASLPWRGLLKLKRSLAYQ